jgi:hypothetical protein
MSFRQAFGWNPDFNYLKRLDPRQKPSGMTIFLQEAPQYKHKRGSHHILIYPGARRAVLIPEYDEIDAEIIKNNMKTVGMTREGYFELLKRA